MVPSATLLQMQPTWVQTALNALNVPFSGCVTTTFAAVNATPPPTGTCFALPRGVPAGAAAAPEAGPLAAVLADVDEDAPGATPASFASYGTAAVLHPASAPAPASPTPSSTPRLVALWSCWEC
jgi:hypothetical protein